MTEIIETIKTLDGTAYVRVYDGDDIRNPKRNQQIVYCLLVDSEHTFQIGFWIVVHGWHHLPNKVQKLTTLEALAPYSGTFNHRMAIELFASLVNLSIYTEDEKHIKRYQWRE